MNPEEYNYQAQSALNRQQIDTEQNINAFGMMQGQREIQAALVDQMIVCCRKNPKTWIALT